MYGPYTSIILSHLVPKTFQTQIFSKLLKPKCYNISACLNDPQAFFLKKTFLVSTFPSSLDFFCNNLVSCEALHLNILMSGMGGSEWQVTQDEGGKVGN